MFLRSLRRRTLASSLLIACLLTSVGCDQRAVRVEPEEGGLLPPPNPPAVEVEAKLPTLIESGQSPWLDASSLPLDAWYSLYLNSRCVGYSHLNIAPSGINGSKLMVLTKRDVLEIPATATKTAQRREIVLESYERPNGEFLNFTESSKAEESASEVSGQLQRENFTATHLVDGKPQSVSLAWPKGAWGPLGVVAVLREFAKQSNEAGIAQAYLPPLGKFAKVELKRGAKSWTTLPGSGSAELLLVETTIEVDGNRAVTKNWLNADGEIMKSISQDGLTMFRTTQAEAERIDSEIQAAQMVASKIPIGATAAQLMTPEITFSIDSEKLDPFTVLSSKVNQSTKSLSALGAELTVQRVTPDDSINIDLEQDPPTPEFSKPIDADSIQLKKFLARLATAAEAPDQTQLAVAKQLTEAVFRELKKTQTTRQFLSAGETLQMQSGDSKAHSLLLIAALRRFGLPARAASGLRIVKSGDSIVGIYHMWCEAWLDGRWMPLDPFVGSVGVGVDHIKFLESSLNETNRNSAMLPVLKTMSQLTIAVKP